jgi:hypothetical protein
MVAGLVLTAVTSIGPSQAKALGFCEPGLARDYEAPLTAMKPIRRIAFAHELGTSGAELSFTTTGNDRLVVGTGRIGARLSRRSLKPRVHSRIRSRLVRVNRSGRSLRTLAEHKSATVLIGRKKWRTSYDIDLSGFYRLDLMIENRHGLQTHKFSEYVRDIRPQTDVQLSTNAESVVAEQRIMMRLENIGTRSVYFGLEYRIERYDGSHWIEDPHTPKGFPQVGLGLTAGGKAPCERFLVSSTMADGRYRIVKPYVVGPNGRKTRWATREFVVRFQ